MLPPEELKLLNKILMHPLSQRLRIYSLRGDAITEDDDDERIIEFHTQTKYTLHVLQNVVVHNGGYGIVLCIWSYIYFARVCDLI